MEFTTQRLIFRLYEQEYIIFLYSMLSDSEMMREWRYAEYRRITCFFRKNSELLREK